MADVKWIKITTDIFSDEKVLLIEQMPDADTIIVIWFKLLCMAGKENNYGVFLMKNRMPYTEEMLATIFRRPLNTVRLALSTFEAFGMIEIEDDIITIPNWEKHQNIEGMEKIREQTRRRVAKHREKQKQALLEGGNVTSTDNNTVTVTLPNAIDKNRIDKKRIEEENNICSDSVEPEPPAPVKKTKPVKHKYGEFSHVLLTDNEYENLANAFGIELRDKAIKFLDEYIEDKGYKAKSHNMAIRRWVIDAVKEKEQKAGRKEMVPDWMKKKKPGFNDFQQQDYDFDEIERSKLGKTVESDPELAARAEALKKKFKGEA